MIRPFILFPLGLSFLGILSGDQKKNDVSLNLKAAPGEPVSFDWTKPIPLPAPLILSVSVKGGEPARDFDGFGVQGNGSKRVDPGEVLALHFQQDVMVDTVRLDAGKEGEIGGYVQLASKKSPIMKTDRGRKDLEKNMVSLVGLGLLKRGDMLILDPNPLNPKSPTGSWKLVGLTVRPYPQK